MASKNETINFIKENYQVNQDGDFLTLENFEMDGGRTQTVFVNMEEILMCVSSPFASKDAITAEQAISVAESDYMGITRYGNFYAVTHVVPLADLDPSEVNAAFGLVARTADQFEKSLGLGDGF